MSNTTTTIRYLATAGHGWAHGATSNGAIVSAAGMNGLSDGDRVEYRCYRIEGDPYAVHGVHIDYIGRLVAAAPGPVEVTLNSVGTVRVDGRLDKQDREVTTIEIVDDEYALGCGEVVLSRE